MHLLNVIYKAGHKPYSKNATVTSVFLLLHRFIDNTNKAVSHQTLNLVFYFYFNSTMIKTVKQTDHISQLNLPIPCDNFLYFKFVQIPW